MQRLETTNTDQSLAPDIQTDEAIIQDAILEIGRYAGRFVHGLTAEERLADELEASTHSKIEQDLIKMRKAGYLAP